MKHFESSFRLPSAGKVILSLLLFLFTSGCTWTVEFAPEELDKIARSTGARTVVLTDELTVWSPYEMSMTGVYMKIIEEELSATCPLLNVRVLDPLLVWIEEIKSPLGGMMINISDSLAPAKEGAVGRADIEGRFILLYGPPQSSGIGMYDPNSLRRATRHEMAHVVFFLAGLYGDRWLQEGFAEYVRTMHRMKDSGLQKIALPVLHLNPARGLLGQYSLSALLDWEEPLDSLEEMRAHYRLSHSLVHFLIEKQGERSLLEALERIEGLSRKEILAFEPEWRAWLSGLDFASLVREYTASSNAALREEAAVWMVQLARQNCDDILCDEMDRFAIGLLEEPLTAEPAADFILSHRQGAISQELAAEMLNSQQAFTFLVGQALRARRGGAIDQAACEEAYRRLTKEEQENFQGFVKDLFPEGLPAEPEPSGEIM